MDIHFKNKYLKYKSKYHNLKINMEGGKLNVRNLIEYVDNLISKTKETIRNTPNKKRYRDENAKNNLIIAKLKLFKSRYLISGSAPYCERIIRLKFDKKYKKDNQIKESEFKTSYYRNNNFKIIDCISINDKSSYNYVNDIILNFEKLVELNLRPENDNFFKPEYEDNILFDLFNSHDIGSYKLDMSEEAIKKKAKEIAYPGLVDGSLLYKDPWVAFENKEEKEKFKKIIEDYKLKISPILEKRKIEKEKNKIEEERKAEEANLEYTNIIEHIKTFELKRNEAFVNLLKEMNLNSGVEFYEFIIKNREIINRSFDNIRKHYDTGRTKLSVGGLGAVDLKDVYGSSEVEISPFKIDQYVSFLKKNLENAKIFEEKSKTTMVVRSGMTTLEKYIEKNAEKEGTTSVEVAEKLLNESNKLKDLYYLLKSFDKLIDSIKYEYNKFSSIYEFYNLIHDENTTMEFRKLKESTQFISLYNTLIEYGETSIENNPIIKMESEKYPNKENVEGACVFPVYVKDGECKKIVFKSNKNLKLVENAIRRLYILSVVVP